MIRRPDERDAERPQGLSAQAAWLFDAADQIFDLDGVRAELIGEFVEIRSGDVGEARLVDVGDDLDADRLELAYRLVLELERLGRLVLVDLGGRRLHPLLLLGGKALPEL